MLRIAAFASRVVASMPTVFPFHQPRLRQSCQNPREHRHDTKGTRIDSDLLAFSTGCYYTLLFPMAGRSLRRDSGSAEVLCPTVAEIGSLRPYGEDEGGLHVHRV